MVCPDCKQYYEFLISSNRLLKIFHSTGASEYVSQSLALYRQTFDSLIAHCQQIRDEFHIRILILSVPLQSALSVCHRSITNRGEVSIHPWEPESFLNTGGLEENSTFSLMGIDLG